MKRMTWYWMLGGICAVSFVVLIRIPSLLNGRTVAPSHGMDGSLPVLSRMLLRRDLERYFYQREARVSRVDYQLFNAPLESRASVERTYYAWVDVYSGNRVSTAGAVRVAAVGPRFEVQTFIARNTIVPDLNTGQKKLLAAFPASVAAQIAEHAAQTQP